MLTRQEYMKNSFKLFDEYYLQFATNKTRNEVLSVIGMVALLASKDRLLNDVKLPYNNMSSGGGWWWSSVSINTSLLKPLGETNSRLTHTCVGKAVARLLIKE